MKHSNYPPDYDPRIDSGEDEEDIIDEYDDSDEYRETLIDKDEDEDEDEVLSDNYS